MSAIASIGENPRPRLDGTNTGLEFNNIPPLFAIGVIASVGENPRPQPEGRVHKGACCRIDFRLIDGRLLLSGNCVCTV